MRLWGLSHLATGERGGPHMLPPTRQHMKEFLEMRPFCLGRCGCQRPRAGPSQPAVTRTAAQPVHLVTRATQMRPLVITQPRLHSVSDAFIPFTSLESCGGLKRLITKTVKVSENCQFIHQKYPVGMKASNKTYFIRSQVTHPRTSLFLPCSPPSHHFPSSSKLEREKERTG